LTIARFAGKRPSPEELGSNVRSRRCEVNFGGILGDVPHEITALLVVLFQNKDIRIHEAALMNRQYEFERADCISRRGGGVMRRFF
jgi:hypothetical protein